MTASTPEQQDRYRRNLCVVCGEKPMSDPQERVGYVGWVEFIKYGGSTTPLAYLHEHSEPYFPEGGLTEWDLRAAEASGRMWPLVRSDWSAT